MRRQNLTATKQILEDGVESGTHIPCESVRILLYLINLTEQGYDPRDSFGISHKPGALPRASLFHLGIAINCQLLAEECGGKLYVAAQEVANTWEISPQAVLKYEKKHREWARREISQAMPRAGNVSLALELVREVFGLASVDDAAEFAGWERTLTVNGKRHPLGIDEDRIQWLRELGERRCDEQILIAAWELEAELRRRIKLEALLANLEYSYSLRKNNISTKSSGVR